jgi:hypothetical protein
MNERPEGGDMAVAKVSGVRLFYEVIGAGCSFYVKSRRGANMPRRSKERHNDFEVNRGAAPWLG